MSLMNYLYSHFLESQTLLAQTGISQAELLGLQQQRLVPEASYTLAVKHDCQSYFGQHKASEALAFYPKGYPDWLGKLSRYGTEQQVFNLFEDSYRATVESLVQKNLSACALSEALLHPAHIESEWQHFLAGTYGVCTRTGLVEEIAAKALATAEIEAIVSQRGQTLSASQRQRLKQAVALLDRVASDFAPHERESSSRVRLIEKVRNTNCL